MQIKFRMTAYTAAAGKYNPEAPNKGNEDNFYVDNDLGDQTPGCFSSDAEVMLSDCGMLMAVADGMGGMNAGEVASKIAVDTIGEYFAPGRITPRLATSHTSRRKYLEELIVEADARIKADASHNPQHEGMGSTIILAWLAGDELTVSWCGDSRAYRFNPVNGIEMLSEDHSYVQDLVRKGQLTYEQTFGHPQGNIITRSLGDPGGKAKPETRLFKVNKSDIILLCSDGLSGVLFDRDARDEYGNPLSQDNLEDIIRNHSTTMQACREALWKAAEQAEWYDNVTIILCEILDGVPEVTKKDSSVPMAALPDASGSNAADNATCDKKATTGKGCYCRKWPLLVGVLVLMLLCFAGGIFWERCRGPHNGEKTQTDDTLRHTEDAGRQPRQSGKQSGGQPQTEQPGQGGQPGQNGQPGTEGILLPVTPQTGAGTQPQGAQSGILPEAANQPSGNQPTAKPDVQPLPAAKPGQDGQPAKLTPIENNNTQIKEDKR